MIILTVCIDIFFIYCFQKQSSMGVPEKKFAPKIFEKLWHNTEFEFEENPWKNSSVGISKVVGLQFGILLKNGLLHRFFLNFGEKCLEGTPLSGCFRCFYNAITRICSYGSELARLGGLAHVSEISPSLRNS